MPPSCCERQKVRKPSCLRHQSINPYRVAGKIRRCSYYGLQFVDVRCGTPRARFVQFRGRETGCIFLAPAPAGYARPGRASFSFATAKTAQSCTSLLGLDGSVGPAARIVQHPSRCAFLSIAASRRPRVSGFVHTDATRLPILRISKLVHPTRPPGHRIQPRHHRGPRSLRVRATGELLVSG